MANLWEYLTQPSRANKPIDYGNYADETLYNATAVPRFIANSGKSVYDSFNRGIANPNLPDALNVAMGAMVGGTPGVPKGSSPSTLGMAFRRPKDVVYTRLGEFNPTSSTLKEDFGDNYDLYNLISRYHNKTWGTVDDPVIQHIDKGFNVPYIPGLDAKRLNTTLSVAKDFERNGDLDKLLATKTTSNPLAAKTSIGKYVELNRDARELFENTGMSNRDHVFSSRGLPQKTKDYALNTEGVNMFHKPSVFQLATQQLPYKIEGNLNRMSLADMLMQATEKEAALAKIPDEQLHVFDDGHYWTQLKTQAQREAESEAMGNSTRLPMHDGKELYSLRDKNGKSILTASRMPGSNKFDEIKTRFNERDILDELQLSNRKDNEYYDKYLGLFNKLGMDK